MSEGREHLYPRLDHDAALTLIDERKSMSLSDLEKLGALDHPNAAPAATGGHPVDQRTIATVQDEIRKVARAVGYPGLLRQPSNFDRPCGDKLFDVMGIIPADAAHEGVWSFLTLVVLPEIGPWRFPDRAPDRLLGRPRNVLRRNWWRAWAFGAGLDCAPEGCTPLGEDEFVQIMERSSLGGNQRTARALRQVIWDAQRGGLDVARSEFVRELTRRVRAVKPHIALDALSTSRFVELLSGYAQDANAALGGSPLELS